jgi:hypothetical protein
MGGFTVRVIAATIANACSIAEISVERFDELSM